MQTLVTVLSGIALLVWGTHIVRSGVLRVFGGSLRQVLANSVSNPFTAFLAGLGVTGLVQSSSATALLAGSFVGQKLMGLAPALAIMLGADVGTSLVVQVFSLDLSWLSPLLIGFGVLFHLTRKATREGQIGRIAIGLGLIILALQIILQAAQPLTAAAGVKVIFGSLSGDPMLDILIGALFTLMAWSSLAVVLLTGAFVASGVISLKVALFLVIGANLGSGIVAMVATAGAGTASRRVALGNLLFKLVGCVLTLALLPWIEFGLAMLDPDPQRLVVNFHAAFNLLLAAALIGFTAPVARLAERLLPDDKTKETRVAARHLDPAALDTPALATSNAVREVLRIGDIIETMLTGLLTVIRTNDAQLARQIRRMDDDVDGLYTSIKLYLTQIGREALDERDARRWADIISFTINMEQVGDIIERMRRRSGREEDRAAPGIFRGRHGRALRHARPGGRQPAARHERVPERRPEERAAPARDQGRAEEAPAAVRRHPPRPPRRADGALDRDQLAAPRHHQRLQAHQLAHLLGRLPDPRASRRAAADAPARGFRQWRRQAKARLKTFPRKATSTFRGNEPSGSTRT